MKQGALIINYTGHGGTSGLAHEKVVTVPMIESWNNFEHLPIFMTATCEFSRFDDVDRTLSLSFQDRTSAGEKVLLNPNGGGVALFTTTRLVYSGPNFSLNESFYKIVFEKDENNQNYKLGDIMRITKNNTASTVNTRCFTLLGDPALCLAYPEYKIVTESVNGTPLSEPQDTLHALEEVSVKGYIADDNGNKMTNFNGTVNSALFDKAITMNTLNNDGEGVFTYESQNNILYKGQATVTNGEFTFSFMLPKDINYDIGNARLSHYAHNENSDAHGSNTDLIVGGLSEEVKEDKQGPEINLYMNDTTFISGGTTNDHPVLIAYLKDLNGINTSTSGIGHEITAILNGNNNEKINLNDFYQSEKDNFRRGSIVYPLSDLEPGSYTLELKVWDTYNNSSTGAIDFVVTSPNTFIMENLINYPNPFSLETTFRFSHNKPGENLNIVIWIFNTSGQVIRKLESETYSDGFQSGPLRWDGLDSSGQLLSEGMYIYKVRATTEDGQVAEKNARMLIIR